MSEPTSARRGGGAFLTLLCLVFGFLGSASALTTARDVSRVAATTPSTYAYDPNQQLSPRTDAALAKSPTAIVEATLPRAHLIGRRPPHAGFVIAAEGADTLSQRRKWRSSPADEHGHGGRRRSQVRNQDRRSVHCDQQVPSGHAGLHSVEWLCHALPWRVRERGAARKALWPTSAFTSKISGPACRTPPTTTRLQRRRSGQRSSLRRGGRVSDEATRPERTSSRPGRAPLIRRGLPPAKLRPAHLPELFGTTTQPDLRSRGPGRGGRHVRLLVRRLHDRLSARDGAGPARCATRAAGRGEYVPNYRLVVE